jgi:hypothetical protein
MPERGTAVAAIARSNFNRGLVNKFHDLCTCKNQHKRPASAGLLNSRQHLCRLLALIHRITRRCDGTNRPQTGVMLTT